LDVFNKIFTDAFFHTNMIKYNVMKFMHCLGLGYKIWRNIYIFTINLQVKSPVLVFTHVCNTVHAELNSKVKWKNYFLLLVLIIF